MLGAGAITSVSTWKREEEEEEEGVLPSADPWVFP